MTKPIVYLAGPMSGYEDFNYQAFDEAERRWTRKGYAVLNPANTFGRRTDLTKATYMRAAIMMLLQADYCVMLYGWRYSAGAQLEHAIAEAIGIRTKEDEEEPLGGEDPTT